MHSHKKDVLAFAQFVLDVLILVLMEDALAQKNNLGKKKVYGSLNPCFNGRCTRTI